MIGMPPLFIFGTGRCGSTHLQRIITLHSPYWVWGEHGGFLTPMLKSLKEFEGSRTIELTVGSTTELDDDALISRMAEGHGTLAWMNRLPPDVLSAKLASLIDSLFRKGLPDGWRAWAFKEIRYGLNDDSPRTLLDLFPGSKAVFTFREPASTFQSMLHAWHEALCSDDADELELEYAYEKRVEDWKEMVRYFLELKDVFPERLLFLSMEKLNRPAEDLIRRIGLPVARRPVANLEPTNGQQELLSKSTLNTMAECFVQCGGGTSELFRRALALSDGDFGASGPQMPGPAVMRTPAETSV